MLISAFIIPPEIIGLGFLSTKCLNQYLKIGDSGYDRYEMERNYYLMGGYDFEVNRDISFSVCTGKICRKRKVTGRYQW